MTANHTHACKSTKIRRGAAAMSGERFLSSVPWQQGQSESGAGLSCGMSSGRRNLWQDRHSVLAEGAGNALAMQHQHIGTAVSRTINDWVSRVNITNY